MSTWHAIFKDYWVFDAFKNWEQKQRASHVRSSLAEIDFWICRIWQLCLNQLRREWDPGTSRREDKGRYLMSMIRIRTVNFIGISYFNVKILSFQGFILWYLWTLLNNLNCRPRMWNEGRQCFHRWYFVHKGEGKGSISSLDWSVRERKEWRRGPWLACLLILMRRALYFYCEWRGVN